MTITTTTPPPYTHTIHIFVLILHFQNYDQAAKRRFYQEEKVNYPGGLNPVWRGGGGHVFKHMWILRKETPDCV